MSAWQMGGVRQIFFFFFLTEDVFSLIAFCGPLPLFITNTTNTYWLLFFGDESKLFHWLQYEGDGLSLMVMGLTLNTDSNKQWVKCDNISANRLFYFFIEHWTICSNIFVHKKIFFHPLYSQVQVCSKSIVIGNDCNIVWWLPKWPYVTQGNLVWFLRILP